MSTPLIVVRPIVVTDATLLSTDVPEADYPAYVAGTTYGLGVRVIRSSTHRVYESAAAGNVGHTPETSPTFWLDAGPTNRWALLDQSNSTATAKPSSMSYVFQLTEAVSSLGALSMTGVISLRIRLQDSGGTSVYDNTIDLTATIENSDWWSWFYGARSAPFVALATDLPGLPGLKLLVDFTGSTDLAVGTLVFGAARSIGQGVLYGAKVGIQDYSRKETDDFGNVVLVERPFSKRANFEVPVLSAQVDDVIDFLSSIRATPCLWIGSRQYASTVVYGYYKEFDVNIAYSVVSECTLDVEGLV